MQQPTHFLIHMTVLSTLIAAFLSIKYADPHALEALGVEFITALTAGALWLQQKLFATTPAFKVVRQKLRDAARRARNKI